MIKLKDILAESTNIELHKVITDKTEPAFMTEEQWAKKWSNNSIINETAFSKKQLLLMEKTIPGSIWSKARTAILKYIASGFLSRLPGPQLSQFMNFIKTGKSKKSQARKIYDNMVLGFRNYGLVTPAIAFFVVNFSWLWLPVMWYLGSAVLSVAFLIVKFCSAF